jgi:hypothetical protein
MSGYIDISLTSQMGSCKTEGCERPSMLHGHFQDERDIGYCGFCCGKRIIARRHCGVCQNDLSAYRVYSNTCEEHTGMTLRKCANPDCDKGYFYRNRDCVCILRFVDLPFPKYSYRGDDYCETCLPVIAEMNKQRRRERIQFQRAVKARNARLQTIAEEDEREALLERVAKLDINALRRSLYEDEEDYTQGVYPTVGVEIEHTLVIKVKTKHPLPRSVSPDKIEYGTGNIPLSALPESLKGEYAGDEIPKELIVVQRVSDAKSYLKSDN